MNRQSGFSITIRSEGTLPPSDLASGNFQIRPLRGTRRAFPEFHPTLGIKPSEGLPELQTSAARVRRSSAKPDHSKAELPGQRQNGPICWGVC